MKHIRKNIHLICNAHLDPVWLWRWEEGCTEALATFRTASVLIDAFPGFVFNHNESILYEWVRDHEPELFDDIRQKIANGRWHIMGGWYLQPDCNMPAGESFIRNMLVGRRFFRETFGVSPTTAINFDSFGHSRGLVQLLVQAGYDSYLVCRPAKRGFPFASQDFRWKGLDGSEIVVHRSDENYNSVWGHAAEELRSFLGEKAAEPVTLSLWGVGDHGGGPSHKDLTDLARLSEEAPEHLLHSTPEAYFQELRAIGPELPVVENGLNPVAPGCYTSQIAIKRRHRQLENELYATEKMAVSAVLNGLTHWNDAPLRAAERDLLFSEFHDALPGSGSRLVEADTLRQIDHGLQELSHERLRLALALSAGQAPIEDGTSVVLVWNPHPFPITGVVEIECGTPKQNWDKTFLYPTVHIDGKPVPTQTEKELSDFAIDWRKRAAIWATLPAGAMTRMEVHFHAIAQRPAFDPLPINTPFHFDNGRMQVTINPATGLLDAYLVDGKAFCRPNSFQLIAREDTFNSWGLLPGQLDTANAFSLLPPHEGSSFSGLLIAVAPSVRIIEDGDVRTVVEAVFGYQHSRAWQRYLLPKRGTAFEVEIGVYWNERDKYIKLRIDTTLPEPEYWGQIVMGRERLAGDGEEAVAQKWTALCSGEDVFTVINDGLYGSSAANGSIGLTLLRSAGYAAGDCSTTALREIRFSPRMDQGLCVHRFRVEAGKAGDLLHHVDQEALAFNERPYMMACNPSGRGEKPVTALETDNPGIQLSCMKRAEDGDGFILRFYESEGRSQTVTLRLFGGRHVTCLSFTPFQIRTFRFRPETGELVSCALLEGY